MLATLLTIIIPGLGHLYYGHNKKAFLLIGLSIVGAYFIPLLLFVYPYALYDIWKISKKSPKPKFNKSEAIQIVVIGLITPIILVIMGAISIPFIVNYYQNNILFPKKVQIEGFEIVRALERYHKSYGQFPENLAKLIEGNPLRQRWRNDPWRRPYYYKTNELRDFYILVSSGPDGLVGTADDYIFKNETEITGSEKRRQGVSP